MSEYIFKEIHFWIPENLENGHWLWIWNADKIPPHIGISENSSYYSLTYRDCEVAISATDKKDQALRGGIPLVLIELEETRAFSDFKQVFSSYVSAVEDSTTCLRPVLQTLGVSTEIPQLSELLKLLESEAQLKQVFALNLTEDYKGIPAYSVSDIIRRIGQLHEANGRKHKTKTS